MRRAFVTAASMCSLAVLAGCGGGTEESVPGPERATGELLSWRFTVEPDAELRVGENALTVTILRPDESPVEGATLTVELLHLAHGHGGEGPTSIREASPGVYRVEGLGVTMSGLWSCTFDATSGAEHDRAVFEWDVL